MLVVPAANSTTTSATFDDIPPVDSPTRGTTWGPGISDDFLEFYNLVFTQYYRDRQGNDELLPKKNIDTGMGLERTVQILQGKNNVYETDIFGPLIDSGCQPRRPDLRR